MKVSELMTQRPVTVGPDATCGEAATLMKQEDCGSLPVVEAGRLVGIVTDRDIVGDDQGDQRSGEPKGFARAQLSTRAR